MTNRWFAAGFASVLAFTVGAVAPIRAQAGIPLGSTVIAGASDSLFQQFLTFLNQHGDSATALDNRRHIVQAKVKGVAEQVVFKFDSRGDSTAITAQGTAGGMAALIMGLGVVEDWLQGRRKASADSKPNLNRD